MSNNKSPADGDLQSPRKAKGLTFRVSTMNDFNSNNRNERIRRRSGLPSTACQTCRSRKVKCDIAPDRLDFHCDKPRSGLPRCQACQLADIECRWDTVDKRKRRRVIDGDAQSQNKGIEALKSIAVGGVEHQQPEPEKHLGNVFSDQDSPQQPSKKFVGQRESLPDDLRDVSNQGRPTEVTNGPESTPTESQAIGIPESYCSVPSPELLSIESMDWSEIQDFVLDFEGMEDVSNMNWDNILEEGQTINATETPMPPSKSIRLRLYRRFGPTAALPGLRKLSVAVSTRQKERDGDSDRESPRGASTPHYRKLGSTKGSSISRHGVLSEGSPYDLPVEAIRRVADVFFDRLAGHFPFINEHILHGHIRSGQCSSFLLNSVVAVTLRFYPSEVFPSAEEPGSDNPWRNGAYFLKRAKEQLMSLLAIPTTDVVSGILILAWAEFGDNNEAGLWMLSGMAIRMAQDMGLHRSPERETTPTVAFWDRSPLSPDGKGLLSDEMSKLHQAKSKLMLFWTVFVLDVSVSLLTGRPPTLKRSEVDVPIPTPQDMKATQLDFVETVSMKNMIFPQVAKFMLSFSEAVELLNQTWSDDHNEMSGSQESTKRAKLSKVEDNIMNQYHSLSSDLTFTIENYRRAAADKQAGLFLMLHVYFYAFTILLSQANMGKSSEHASERMADSIPQPRTALLACQKVVQILNTAELVDNTGYLSTPFINQGLFVSASTVLEEQQSKQKSQTHKANDLLSLVSSSDVDYLCRKLREMSRYFKGVGVTLAAVERKKREMLAYISRGNNASEDEESDDEKNEVAQLSDGGIVNRYSIPEEEG